MRNSGLEESIDKLAKARAKSEAGKRQFSASIRNTLPPEDVHETEEEKAARILREADEAARKAKEEYGENGPYWTAKD